MTPIGLVRMCVLPQGWTNSVTVFVRIMNKVYRRHIHRKVLAVFLDHLTAKGPSSSTPDPFSFVIPGVRKFVFEHLKIVAGILDDTIRPGLTISGLRVYFS